MKPSPRNIRLGTQVRDSFGTIRTVTHIHRASVTLDRHVRATWEMLAELYTLYQFTLPAGTPWFDPDNHESGVSLLDCEVQVLPDGLLLTPLGRRILIAPDAPAH